MILQLENLSAGYGQLSVLKEVSLEIEAGEMVVLIGPNGAGKSTILKSICGFTTKTNGRVLFEGEDVDTWSPQARIANGIGFVPQGRLVFSSLTVKENLEMGGYSLKQKSWCRIFADRRKIDTTPLGLNLEHVFRLFPILREKQKEFAGTLSGGQQQQLAIGRALMTRPKLLMLDEPTLGLSPKLMHEVFETLQKIRETGTTILVVEQNVRLALRYVDRGYLLANGMIRLSGSAKELAEENVMQSAYL